MFKKWHLCFSYLTCPSRGKHLGQVACLSGFNLLSTLITALCLKMRSLLAIYGKCWEVLMKLQQPPTTLLLVLPGHTLGSCRANHLDKKCVFSSHEQSASREKLPSCANSGVQNSLFLIRTNSVRNLRKPILDVVLRFFFLFRFNVENHSSL